MEENPYEPPTSQAVNGRSRRRARMNAFDYFCAVFAFTLGIFLLLLGAIGLFVGCHGAFGLPPLFGCLPAFVGWGIVRAVYVAWNASRPAAADDRPADDGSVLPPNNS
jgi:hypothetical protein